MVSVVFIVVVVVVVHTFVVIAVAFAAVVVAVAVVIVVVSSVLCASVGVAEFVVLSVSIDPLSISCMVERKFSAAILEMVLSSRS